MELWIGLGSGFLNYPELGQETSGQNKKRPSLLVSPEAKEFKYKLSAEDSKLHHLFSLLSSTVYYSHVDIY